ncbi:transposase [Massilia sp. PWRC2]|uniref:transposase n=1 Tax=Massilia sp. PWRC2 TaxID=2804626 RepID=UPI003CF8CF1A
MKNIKQQQAAATGEILEGASEGAPGASAEAPSKKSDAEVVAVARRRKFSPAYIQRIVREADACTAPGAIGELLRREGLYSSHLSTWRSAVAASDAALQSPKRGPKPDPAKAADRQLARLQMENDKLRKQLGRAEQIIDVQKKLCDLLGLPTAGEAP